jgi:pterin-4a-carbinolamine dehydratase
MLQKFTKGFFRQRFTAISPKMIDNLGAITQNPSFWAKNWNLADKNGFMGVKRGFAFFGGRMSTKLGEKCCKYGQNGKPLGEEKAKGIYSELKVFIEGWRFNEDHTRLYRYFYCKDFEGLMRFVNEMAGADLKSVNNKPEFHIMKGDLVKVELVSHELKGLSRRDFELAVCINQINLEDMDVIPVKSERNYRAEARMVLKKKEDDEAQQQLAEDFMSTAK